MTTTLKHNGENLIHDQVKSHQTTPVKICYVVTIPETIEGFFVPQLRYLSENGFDVTCVCTNADTLKHRFEGTPVNCKAVSIPRGFDAAGMLKATRKLTDFFRQESFDIVQYSTPNAGFCAAIASKHAGTKIRLYHLMGLRYLGEAGAKRLLLKHLEKYACGLSTHIECVSKSNLDLCIREGLFPPNKGTVVWNGSSGGVDLKRFDFKMRDVWRREARKELGLADDDYIYGFVGRITHDKGINELLEAFRNIDNNGKLLLIGAYENPELLDADLLNWARSNNRVIIREAVHDIERYYPALDALVLPSYREGFGNVVIEAAAMGVPAIITNIPGPIDAVIPGRTALIVEPKNSRQLKKAMEAIPAISDERQSEACHEFASLGFDADKLCRIILQRKRDILEQHE